MTTVRWKLVDRLRELGFETTHTYGHITKMRRKEAGIEKTHANDAFVIAGGTGDHEMQKVILLKKQTRKCNRKLFKGDRGLTMPSGYELARRGAAHSSPGTSPGVSCAML